MLEQLKEKVYIANQDLLEQCSYPFSWVSVSAIDRETGLVVMMPDGGAVTEEDMAVVDLHGQVLEGKEPPVCDTAIHLALYEKFPHVASIAHPYSRWATIFAQLEMSIPTLGTIHADHFRKDIVCAHIQPGHMLDSQYHGQIANAIAETFQTRQLTPAEVPAVLVGSHGAYTFGTDAREAVGNACILDEVAFLAYHTMQMDPGIRSMPL